MSQDPDTKDYILILQSENHCIKCGDEYTDIWLKWCVPCKISYSEINYTISGNEKIDNLIQEMQLKVSKQSDIVFEWIPYSQFNNIDKEIGNYSLVKVYSAIWKDGPLMYNYDKKKYTRNQQDEKVSLKCLYNSQNITDEFLSKV